MSVEISLICFSKQKIIFVTDQTGVTTTTVTAATTTTSCSKLKLLILPFG